MSDNVSKLLHSIRPAKIIYPIVIGLSVVFYLIYKELDIQSLSLLRITRHAVLFLLLALALMAMRDIGYMIRIRVLSNNELNWRQAFRVIMLWEFTSAVTPSAVGGTSVATVFLAKEGINVGRSASIVLATSFLDELYFVLVFPILMLCIKPVLLFSLTASGIDKNVISFTNELFLFAAIGYFLKFIWFLLVTYGLFLRPRGLKWLLLKIFKLPGLKRWRYGAQKAGDDIIKSSSELKKEKKSFWMKAFGATAISWTSRFLVVNALLLAFFNTTDQIMIFARQFIMSNMMLVSPTPGASGVSEYIFSRYLAAFIPVDHLYLAGLAITLALIWRFITYYPYLIIGVIIVPSWIKSKFTKPIKH